MKTRTTKEIFGENLRNQLLSRNKKQADLAKFTGASSATVSYWCNGEAMPRANMIDKICVFLNCSVEDLTIDHNKVAIPAPTDILADEISNRPILFQLFMLAIRATDGEIQKCIEVLKK